MKFGFPWKAFLLFHRKQKLLEASGLEPVAAVAVVVAEPAPIEVIEVTTQEVTTPEQTPEIPKPEPVAALPAAIQRALPAPDLDS